MWGAGGTIEAAGIAVMGVIVSLAGPDILLVHEAAERTNARHGLGSISPMPMPLVGPKSVGAGNALGGPF
jgi:hypothetical protein